MARKNREDWLKAGLRLLAEAGLTGLTIDAMALELRLTKRGAGLYGEVAAARLTALAAALKAEPSVRLP